MRRWTSLTIGILLIIAIGSYSYFNNKITKAFLSVIAKNPRLHVKSVQWRFPNTILFHQLALDHILEPCHVQASFDWASLNSDQIHLTHVHIDEPRINFTSSTDNIENQKSSLLAQTMVDTSSKDKQERSIVVDFIGVYNGHVTMMHHEKPIILRGIMGEFSKVQAYPLGHMEFHLAGSMPEHEASSHFGHGIRVKGWINWPKRDLQASLSMEKNNGQDDVLWLQATLTARDNDLKVDGHLDVHALGSVAHYSPLDVLVNLPKVVSALETNFSFQTKLDQVQLSNISFSGYVEPLDSSDQQDGFLQNVQTLMQP